MPVFFISSANIQNNRLTLDGLLYSHLAKSLRVRKGEIIQVNDEHKQRYVVRVTQVTNQALIGEVEKLLSGPSDEKPSVTLVQSILRGPNMVWVIQKATELGVCNIIPVITERVKSRSDIRSISHLHDRWEKIALEAAQQSECWVLPQIQAPQSFEEFLEHIPADSQKYMLTERQEEILSRTHYSLDEVKIPSDVLLAVGPEGGWTQGEIQSARSQGFIRVSLGEKVLRSETATIAGLILLKARFKQIKFSSFTEA